jgi:hypothetical protein
MGSPIGATEGRDFLMHARIGARALNRHVERAFNPDRRTKRKLKKDRWALPLTMRSWMTKSGCGPDGAAGGLCRSSTLPRATGLPLERLNRS